MITTEHKQVWKISLSIMLEMGHARKENRPGFSHKTIRPMLWLSAKPNSFHLIFIGLGVGNHCTTESALKRRLFKQCIYGI